jgi:hypothetical protein
MGCYTVTELIERLQSLVVTNPNIDFETIPVGFNPDTVPLDEQEGVAPYLLEEAELSYPEDRTKLPILLLSKLPFEGGREARN